MQQLIRSIYEDIAQVDINKVFAPYSEKTVDRLKPLIISQSDEAVNGEGDNSKNNVNA